MQLLAVLVILGCVSVSWQRCFDYHCPHHTDLAGCVQGSYTCQATEFCEAVTHLSHGNAPWVLLNCRPDTVMADCWALQAANDPNCDPTRHDIICHWCCDTEQCMRDLAKGVIPQPSGSGSATTMAPAATTMAPAVTMTTMMPTTTMMPATATQTIPPDTTVNATCVDLYLGDCMVDFSGRCGEPLIQQLCQRTCNAC